MPRSARLDAPGALHHVMARGIERRALCRSDHDKGDLLSRLATCSREAEARIFAWALLPNHLHALLRSGHACRTSCRGCSVATPAPSTGGTAVTAICSTTA